MPSLTARRHRLLLGTLGAAMAASLAACAVESDEGLAPSTSPDAPSAATGTSGSSASGASSAGLATGLNREAVERALGQLSLAKDLIHSDARHQLMARDVIVDPDGREHVRFDRKFLGMKVIGGDLVAHLSPNGGLDGVSQTLGRTIDLDPAAAKLDAAAAGSAALSSLGDVAAPSIASTEMIVLARDAAPALAYEVVVTGTRGEESPTEMHLIVDAGSGALLDSWDGIENAAAAGTNNGRGFFVGTVSLTADSVSTGGYELKDPSRGNLTTVNMNGKQGGTPTKFLDTDNTWANGLLTDPVTVAVDAQFGTAMTWDYYLNVHGRNGIANDGKGAQNRVHYGKNYANAFWSDSCFCMTYGDGNSTFNPFDSLDVAGHEMTHGVTSRTVNLTYSGESGGLNEATSDIFGTMVEWYANNSQDTPDYDIGEKLYKTSGKALRYMAQPSKDGSSPDCYTSTLGSLDVHYSSGVANHFFYLLAEGSGSSITCSGTDTKVAKGGPAVTGVGRSAAEKIWYRALTVYMNASTKYAGARTATINAANDLYASDSTVVAAVRAAWDAVQVK